MSNELDDIRAKKSAAVSERLKAVSDEIDEIDALKNAFAWKDFGFYEPEWGFRMSQEVPDAFEICQRGQTVALTQDTNWCMLVCDLLNRARMEELIANQGGKMDE